MSCARKWFILWSLWAARFVPQYTPPVQLASSAALVRGLLAPDGSHYQYFGVPYATVETGRDFMAPGPAPVWEGVLDAVNEHKRCLQKYADWLVVGTRDCLVLNVYAPARVGGPAGTLPPVMVFIHGGGFKEGAGTRLLYGPDYLVSKGVVLVTINYRVSVPGFLCLGIKEAPGNAGLKDQVAALKWVQANIRAFGGDPDNVTIFGESAGGASVSFHVVSRASKGLFHKAIAQSGSSLAPWAMQSRPLQIASQIAAKLGYRTDDPQELYRVFTNHSLSELVRVPLPPRRGDLRFANLPHVPCVERAVPGGEPFLSEHPRDILSRGEHNKVPVIIGANDEEGYYFAAEETEDSMRHIAFNKALPNNLYFQSEAERNAVAEEFEKLYMRGRNISIDNILQLSRLHGHPHFQFPAAKEVELLLNSSDWPVYAYVFTHNGWRNFPKLISGWRFWLTPGATHADDLFYLFSLFPVPSLFESSMIDTMTTLWTNFAKYGTPSLAGDALQWGQAVRGADLPRVLVLGRRASEGPPPHAAALALWRRVYAQFGQ